MSNFKPRNLLLVMALALALVLLAVIALRYRPESQLQTIVEALPKGVDVSLQDIDYTHIEEGRPRWRLVAQRVERQTTSGLLGVGSPQMSFYDDHGTVKGSLQAALGEVSEDYQHVRLRGEVILKDPAGYTLHADMLDYDQAAQTVSTDGHVRLSGSGLHLEGTGLLYELKRERLQLNADVKGSFDFARKK